MRAHRHKNNDRNRGRNRGSRMQNNAERAVIGVGVERMNVGHLHHGHQSQQDQAQHRHHRRIARKG
jgi:hypothetical protein